MSFKIIPGDCLEVLKTLPAESVHCCVTSPPYWGLRDYGVDGQIGLEKTPELFVSKMVEVFREVKRVLRDDGTLWLNLGDSYAGGGNYRGIDSEATLSDKQRSNRGARGLSQALGGKVPDGMKAKDLCGIPWLVAFALRADGWYLRSDIIWHKPNPMPESVTDRPTKSHEYIFLLTKSPKYYYDAEAVKEPVSDTPGAQAWRRIFDPTKQGKEAILKDAGIKGGNDGRRDPNATSRNKRSVWTVATAPFSGAHFATFPPKLIEPCILAGTSEQGCCSECGAPWERVVERIGSSESVAGPKSQAKRDQGLATAFSGYADGSTCPSFKTVGWQHYCNHREIQIRIMDGEPLDEHPCTVLDPFAGAGTTGLVARRLGRSFIGIELNPEYLNMAENRIVDDSPLFNTLGGGQ
jgi:DNA modification methylase